MRVTQHFWFSLLLAAVVCAFSAGRLSAATFSVLEAGDPVLEELRFAAREAGVSTLGWTPPFSRGEAQKILDSIDTARLSAAGRDAYIMVQKSLDVPLRYESGIFGLAARVEIEPEVKFRTETAIPYREEYRDSPTLLALPLQLFFANRAQIKVVPSLTNSPLWYDRAGEHIGTNVVTAFDHTEPTVPMLAYGAAGGSWWDVAIGHGKVNFGLGRTGNLAVSDNPDYYDYVKATLFSRVFKYTFFMSQVPIAPGADFLGEDESARDDRYGEPFTREGERYMYIHRIDARLWQRVSIGITEGTIATGSPEFRFFNPLMAYHSFFSWDWRDRWGKHKGLKAGSMFSVDVDIALAHGLAFYGQMVMNDYALPWELAADSNQPADEFGFLFGLEYMRDIKGWRGTFFLEGAITSPYQYTIWSPYASWIWYRDIQTPGGNDGRYRYIGYAQGRDAIVAALGAKAARGKLAFDTEIKYAARGRHNALVFDWELTPAARAERTPSGTAQHEIGCKVGAAWQVAPTLRLAGYVGGVYVVNTAQVKGKDDAGLDCGVSVKVVY